MLLKGLCREKCYFFLVNDWGVRSNTRTPYLAPYSLCNYRIRNMKMHGYKTYHPTTNKYVEESTLGSLKTGSCRIGTFFWSCGIGLRKKECPFEKRVPFVAIVHFTEVFTQNWYHRPVVIFLHTKNVLLSFISII